MTFTKWCVFLFLFTILSDQSASAQGKVTIAVDEANPPFSIVKNGRAEGVYPALLREIILIEKLNVELVPLPWRRALLGTDSAELATAGLYSNKERLAKYIFSDELFVERLCAFGSEEKIKNIFKFSDMKGSVIGINAGWSLGDYFDGLRRDNFFIVEEGSNSEINFKKLAAGRLDFMVTAIDEGQFRIERLKLNDTIKWSPILTENPVYVAIHKKDDNQFLIPAINQGLKSLSESGKYNEIVKQGLAAAAE